MEHWISAVCWRKAFSDLRAVPCFHFTTAKHSRVSSVFQDDLNKEWGSRVVLGWINYLQKFQVEIHLATLSFCHLFHDVVTGILLETLINSRNPFYFSIILIKLIPVPFLLPNSKKLHIYCNISAVKQFMFHSHLQHKHLKLNLDLASLFFDQEKFAVIIYLHTSLCLEL